VESLSQRNLAIIGQGYVGLPLAMAAVDAGWNVVGVDNSVERVAALNRGTSPVEDISDQLLASAIASKKYIATTNFADIASASCNNLCSHPA
jgi:UDP-N-acetyl-D-mannosaminuronate dehydrogenase